MSGRGICWKGQRIRRMLERPSAVARVQAPARVPGAVRGVAERAIERPVMRDEESVLRPLGRPAAESVGTADRFAGRRSSQRLRAMELDRYRNQFRSARAATSPAASAYAPPSGNRLQSRQHLRDAVLAWLFQIVSAGVHTSQARTILRDRAFPHRQLPIDVDGRAKLLDLFE